MPNPFSVNEDSTALYQATLKDENGAAIPAAGLSALTLTLYNDSSPSQQIINNRNSQNVLNQNNVTVDSNGILRWTMQPADNKLFDSALAYEEHLALFKFEWQAGAKRGYHEVLLRVKNLNKVAS